MQTTIAAKAITKQNATITHNIAPMTIATGPG
uniref:Uncharacterized protein n=1 Tax=Haemonchus placei TaxID=6290 RepID=A0A0N4WEE9_HAEPC